MSVDLAGDIDLALADCGATITVGGVDYSALVEAVDLPVLAQGGAMILARKTRVTVRTGAIPGLAEGTAVTYGGKSYTADVPQRLDDTMLTEFNLILA